MAHCSSLGSQCKWCGSSIPLTDSQWIRQGCGLGWFPWLASVPWVLFYALQWYIRGQHHQGQGQTTARPRPGHFEAMAAKIRPRVWGQSLRTPSHLHTKESITLNSSNCLITSCCKAYCPIPGQGRGQGNEKFSLGVLKFEASLQGPHVWCFDTVGLASGL